MLVERFQNGHIVFFVWCQQHLSLSPLYFIIAKPENICITAKPLNKFTFQETINQHFISPNTERINLLAENV